MVINDLDTIVIVITVIVLIIIVQIIQTLGNFLSLGLSVEIKNTSKVFYKYLGNSFMKKILSF